MTGGSSGGSGTPASTDTTLNSDLVKIFVSLIVSILIGILAYFQLKFLFSAPLLLQEYHKIVDSITAIFLAFSPAFFIFLYSSESIKLSITNLGIRHSIDRYFVMSILTSLAFMINSIIGIVFSYIDYNSIATPTLLLNSHTSINGFIFSLSIVLAAMLLFWNIFYGRFVLAIIKALIH